MILTPRTRSALAAGLAFAALVGTPALAQLNPLTEPLPRTLDQRSDKRLDRVEQTLRELRSIIYQGKDTGRAVVVQPAETQAALDQMSQRLQDMEASLRRVNGALDGLTTDIASLRRDTTPANAQASSNAQSLAAANARIDSLERQITALTTAAIQAARPAPVAPPTPQASNDPARDFDNAMRLYTDGQFRAAASAFETYLDAHGDAPDAQEASYYLGEAKFRGRDFEGASIGYIGAIRGWPTTTWAPDAMVKLAQSLIEIKKTPDACRALDEFNTRYPRAGAAVKTAAAQTRARARCT
jgi:tol-pal system protein YbgF